MPRLTTKQRRRKTLALLQLIRDGKKHTKANAVLAPLSQANLIGYNESMSPHYHITDVWLTDSGKFYIEFYEKELAAGRLD